MLNRCVETYPLLLKGICKKSVLSYPIEPTLALKKDSFALAN